MSESWISIDLSSLEYKNVDRLKLYYRYVKKESLKYEVYLFIYLFLLICGENLT